MSTTDAFAKAFAGCSVFVTGHTGFKGAWLSLWLSTMGAEVTGYALEPPTQPSLFAAAGLSELVDSVIADVRDRDRLAACLQAARPSVVFHLAAQPLVRVAYADPHETFETNVMGTVNLLEAVRACESVQAVVVITSDKCYENRETGRAFCEEDAMGGRDPYSASKGCAELVTASYRSSFFSRDGAAHPAAVASARAGNVIGGGDWAQDRIIPDCVRAVSAGRPIEVRNPAAVRPWQHVLEPLSGYLLLAALMLSDGSRFGGAWNFGPDAADGAKEVRWVVERFLREWGTGEWTTPASTVPAPHEAHTLCLDSSKAHERLRWRPVWDAADAVEHTAAWYRQYYEATAAAHPAAAVPAVRGSCETELVAYRSAASAAGLAWASAGQALMTTDNGATVEQQT
jgi:CDP-glucose 4,6-dehydratase